jgi:hypothetical protein
VSPTEYEVNYAARIALARSVELEHQLAVAEAEVDRLRSIIRAHRAFRMNVGNVYGSDERLWGDAGLPPYNAPDIKGDM